MKFMLKWGLLIAVLTMFVGAAKPAQAMCNGVFTANPCTGGKLKCVIGKKSCLLGCYKKAAGGVPVDQACLAKCRGKFDGAGDPTKSCFGKKEAKGGCLTGGDTAALECKIDGFVESIVGTLHNSSPVGTANKCLAKKIATVLGYNKCRLGVLVGAAKKGLAPDPVKLQKCTDKITATFAKAELSPPCLTTGDVRNVIIADNLFLDDVVAELVAGQRDMNTQRCSGDTSVKCTSAPGGVVGCGGPLGTCEFYFGTTLPLSAGGISTCVTNQWNGTISGTTNPATGASAGTAAVIAKVYNGITTDQPCPKCVGDSFPNDVATTCAPLGVCSGGLRNGLPCDVNGISPNPSFGSTSLDCPPSPASQIATLPIDLTNANNATQAITISAASPTCNGAPGKLCACGSCSEDSQKPCKSNADCIGTCTNPAGAARRHNACIDDTSVPGDGTLCADVAPSGDGEGACTEGPYDNHCAIETQKGCLIPADCPAAGDTCITVNRPCYLDNGVVGGQIQAQGKFAAPINHWSHPTFASVFCIAPTGSAAVNTVAGLPGAGRLELEGNAVDNGTASTCPTLGYLLPTSTGGVLDTGWTGIAHDASVPSQGKVTVSITGCDNPVPPCGTCTYTGPVANDNALP